MPRPYVFTKEDCKLLEHLFRVHGKPDKGYGNVIKYFRKIAKVFNSMTNGTARTPVQIRNYHRNRKRDDRGRPVVKGKVRRTIQAKRSSKQPRKRASSPLQRLPSPARVQSSPPPTLLSIEPPADIVCQNIRTLSPASTKKTSTATSSNGYMGSEPRGEYRFLVDDIPKPWEYEEISSNFLSSNNDQGSSGLGLEESNIFDDIDNFSTGQASAATNQERNGMSSDLVTILADQARQHHKLKMKLLKEKFRKVDEVYKMKMSILENELEMKQKEHERKMDSLAQKYKNLKDSSAE